MHSSVKLCVEQKGEALRALKATTPAQLWINGLDVLEKLLREQPAYDGDNNDTYTNKKTKQQQRRKFVTNDKPRTSADDDQVAQVVGAQRSSVVADKSFAAQQLGVGGVSSSTAAFVPLAVQKPAKPAKRKQATIKVAAPSESLVF